VHREASSLFHRHFGRPAQQQMSSARCVVPG
jgi:hypothetical protein